MIGETLVKFALTKPGAKKIALVTQRDEGPNSKIREAEGAGHRAGRKHHPGEGGDGHDGPGEASQEQSLMWFSSVCIRANFSLAVFFCKKGFKTTFVSTESRPSRIQISASAFPKP
jgi:hypothetical protein